MNLVFLMLIEILSTNLNKKGVKVLLLNILRELD